MTMHDRRRGSWRLAAPSFPRPQTRSCREPTGILVTRRGRLTQEEAAPPSIKPYRQSVHRQTPGADTPIDMNQREKRIGNGDNRTGEKRLGDKPGWFRQGRNASTGYDRLPYENQPL